MYQKSLREKVSEATRIPKDVSMGMSIIRIMGQNELYIENYRGILEYSDTCLRVLTKNGQIRIWGCKLEIAYYTNDEMKIVGILEQLHFIDGGS